MEKFLSPGPDSLTVKILFYLISLLLFWFLGSVYLRFAERFRLVDVPSHRSSHTQVTIRGGGILFFIALLMGYVLFIYPRYPYFFAGFVLLSLLGLADDKFHLSPKVRLLGQSLSIFLIFLDAGLWQAPWPMAVKVLAFIVAVGFVNAYNFMDGINGITGLYTLSVLGLLYILNYFHPIVPVHVLLLLMLSILAFGYYNFRKKALMFSGDVGTMALAAFLLFIFTAEMVRLNAPVLLALVAIYGVDSALTIIRRIFMKENIFDAHRHHAYQKLVDKCRWPHLKVSFWYALLQFITGLIIIYSGIYLKPLPYQLGVLTFILIIFALLYALIIYRFCENRK